MSYVMQNTNQNLTNQPNDYRTSDIRSDDDVVEVIYLYIYIINIH